MSARESEEAWQQRWRDSDKTWAEELTSDELADELVKRALDPDDYDPVVTIEVAREAAKRLRRMAEPPF